MNLPQSARKSNNCYLSGECCLRHLTPAASAAMVRITASSAVATYMVMQGLLAGCSSNGYGVTD